MSSIQHFTHTHPLTQKFNNVDDFTCDGCGVGGSGTRYRCEPCDYDLHEYCATCPFTLPAVFMHPQHELTLWLIDRKKLSTSEYGQFCNICKGPFKGKLFYKCEKCDFNAHPYCSKLPHPAHNLKYQPQYPGTACEVVNFHLGCLGEWEIPGNTEASSSRSDGSVICKNCGSKDSGKRAQCKPCRELKWERRTKKAETVKNVLEVIMGFLG